MRRQEQEEQIKQQMRQQKKETRNNQENNIQQFDGQHNTMLAKIEEIVNNQPSTNIKQQQDGDGSSQASQSQQQSSQKSQEGDEPDKQGFQIMGSENNTTNQTLLVRLQPNSVLWHKGTVLFSSRSIKQKGEIDDVFRYMLESVNLWNGPPRMLQNTGTEMAYYTISKEDPCNGKILILSESVYKQKFYINLHHLLTINYDSSEYSIKPHANLSFLKLIQANSVTVPLFIALQSSKDTSIIQKCLAEDQHMYLPNARILAMSEGIKYKWEQRNRLARYTGPGFIFFEPRTLQGDVLPTRNRQLILANIGILAVIIGLYVIQHLLLH